MRAHAFRDKVVVITGAAAGIGKATAMAFARQGARVVIGDIDEPALGAAAEEIASATGAQTLGVRADVTDKSDCSRLVETAVERFGRLDVLVNNAGITMRAKLADTTPEVVEKVMRVCFNGTLYCTKYALPHILESRGSIVGISSIAGRRGIPGRTGYSAAKFAVQGFFESLRTEILRTGAHVLVVCPGFTSTGIRASAGAAGDAAQVLDPRRNERHMTADEVGERIMRAVRARKRDLVLTRQGHLTILLNRFFPGLADRLVYRHFAAAEKDLLK
ncbi:MAG: SDR family oxidoreductase [Deltaproteobacteria bacterium]|nr:SDR family oxidoreductase [Deltaproteobacteria bacterium]